MRALYYRIRYAVLIFAKRAPVDRSLYRTLPNGALRTVPSGEVRTLPL